MKPSRAAADGLSYFINSLDRACLLVCDLGTARQNELLPIVLEPMPGKVEKCVHAGVADVQAEPAKAVNGLVHFFLGQVSVHQCLAGTQKEKMPSSCRSLLGAAMVMYPYDNPCNANTSPEPRPSSPPDLRPSGRSRAWENLHFVWRNKSLRLGLLHFRKSFPFGHGALGLATLGRS